MCHPSRSNMVGKSHTHPDLEALLERLFGTAALHCMYICQPWCLGRWHSRSFRLLFQPRKRELMTPELSRPRLMGFNLFFSSVDRLRKPRTVSPFGSAPRRPLPEEVYPADGRCRWARHVPRTTLRIFRETFSPNIFEVRRK